LIRWSGSQQTTAQINTSQENQSLLFIEIENQGRSTPFAGKQPQLVEFEILNLVVYEGARWLLHSTANGYNI